MSTSTELLLIHGQIDSLINYVHWTIGETTLTITALLALFALIQFVYQRKLQKNEIDLLEKKLVKKIENELEKAELRLQTYSEKTIHKVEEDLRKDINYMDADIARRFAIDCSEDKIPALALSWWLRAAEGYVKSDSVEKYKLSIRNAKKALEAIDTEHERNSLFDNSLSITNSFDFLENTHKTEIDLLRDMFKEKCKQNPKKTTPDF